MRKTESIGGRVVSQLVKVHVAWNDSHGRPDKLVAVEFGDDGETCAIETDVLDGDPVEVGDRWFRWYLTENHRRNNLAHARFRFEKIERHVGNIHWDMLWMQPHIAGLFAEHMQEQRHWSLNVAATELWNTWGSLSGEHFIEMINAIERSV